MKYKLDDIGVNGWFFHEDNVISATQKVIEAGFRKVEYTGRQITEISAAGLKKLKNILNDNGVQVGAVNLAVDLVQVAFGDLVFDDQSVRNQAKIHVKHCIDLARELRSPKIIIDFGSINVEGYSKQEALFMESYGEVTDYAKEMKIAVDFLIVPNRMPLGIGQREFFSRCRKLNRPDTGFVFDTANEMAGRGSVHNFSLSGAVKPYLAENLRHIYLANHPGPYMKTFSRALRHDLLEKGYYAKKDFVNLLLFLAKKDFRRQISLHLTAKAPQVTTLKKEHRLLERWLKG